MTLEAMPVIDDTKPNRQAASPEEAIQRRYELQIKLGKLGALMSVLGAVYNDTIAEVLENNQDFARFNLNTADYARQYQKPEGMNEELFGRVEDFIESDEQPEEAVLELVMEHAA